MSTKTALKILFSCILLLGNMAMSAYVLRELFRLRPDQAAREIFTARNR
jgi:hypothetical protein